MPSGDTVSTLFRRIAEKDPERTVLIDGERCYTCREITSLASAYSRVFRDRLGLMPGQVLLAWLDNCPEFVAALGPGEDGEIAVRGPSVMNGYAGGATGDATFRDGYYCTGDRGSLDASGNLNLKGRIRPVVNLSGTKVDPVEVENAIRALPGVCACSVFSVKGPHHNHILKTVITLHEGARVDRADIVNHCRRALAEYKIPRIIDFAASSDLSRKNPAS
jgi:acyl-CoA synthetase (AMP-forming)/AMP-acid ligase II